MPPPIKLPKPDLRRFEKREISISKDKERLRAHLTPWMAEVVRSTHQPQHMRGKPAPTLLVNLASGVDEILSTTGMSLGKGEQKKLVYAQFDFGGLPNGSWYVAHVTFSLLPPAQAAAAGQLKKEKEQAELKARLLAEAEAANKLHPKASAFKVELHRETWVDDIKAGAKLLQGDFDAVHEYAAKAAAIPDNPYTPKDVVMAGVGYGVGAAGKTAERAGKLADKYDKIDKAISYGEKAMKYGNMITQKPEPEDMFQRSQNKIYKTGAGDIVADEVIDAASNLPGAGPFIKGFAAMFFNFAAANYAGAVAKVRGRCYSWFIAGYIQGLTGVALESPPPQELDRFFFNFGVARTLRDSEQDKFRVQIFLLWYSSEHYIIGTTSPGDRMAKPLDWTFPNGYLAFWSPQRLGLSMATLLRTTNYLVD